MRIKKCCALTTKPNFIISPSNPNFIISPPNVFSVNVIVIQPNLLYPDWDGDDETCISDGKEPDYMRLRPEGYMFKTLADCCKKHYNWNYNGCVGIINIPGIPVGSGLYYPDWEGEDKGCKNDGDEPAYMSNNPSAWMFDTLDKCCANRYSWNMAGCLGAGGSTLPTGSNKWYVNGYENGSICVQDCEGASPCGGLANSWDNLHESAKVCCQKKLFWIVASKCEAESTGGTAAGSDQWYVDWYKQTCVKDCVGGAPCGGLAEDWDFLFSSATTCCKEKMPWNKDCGP